MCVWGWGRGREREGEGGERERVCVCVCVDGFIVECPHSPHPSSVYLALRANDEVRCFINIHLRLHYITFTDDHDERCQLQLHEADGIHVNTGSRLRLPCSLSS